MITLEAPLFLVIGKSTERFYLSFNNFHGWSSHLRAKIRRHYCELLKKQMFQNSERIKGRVVCDVTFYPGDNKRARDTDNHCFLHVKWANDALTEIGCWEDDNAIKEIHMRAGPVDSSNPRVEISYRPAETEVTAA
jgi:Holliday junction resolvase RusA-like endonuclease